MENTERNETASGEEELQLAMVYSPRQEWREIYAADEALSHGTLFRALFKPLEGESDRE